MNVAQARGTMDTYAIKNLRPDEVDAVGGGIIPIVVAYYSIGIVGTLYVGAQASLAAMRLGYAANRE
jgi:hypothetical protein